MIKQQRTTEGKKDEIVWLCKWIEWKSTGNGFENIN